MLDVGKESFHSIIYNNSRETLRITDTVNGFFLHNCSLFQVYFSVKDLYYEMVFLVPSLVYQKMRNECFYLFLSGAMESPWSTV